ncbi:hypothetical protein NC661_04210 [Aquibacillus koreensis]|uniref:Uncharacterized protein n=1 Tax=Aquibacillus koreensis TaxID=279446 RepID=A0A9X3WLV2_9BACI|nr:hypothetical protein [Aquibacillus koreensis]MCT2534823.1 hypothetical protein [Aquibacillus koreensis]MDC3419566.1 hypothetical protein [Aquibacillus koreensis]
MKKMLILFVATSIPFGLIMGLLFRDLTLGVMAGLGYGLFMTLILGSLQLILGAKLGAKLGTSVKQKNEMELPLPLKEAILSCRNSVIAIHGAKIEQQDYTNGTGIIHVKTKVNIRTWGEKITFRVQKVSDEVTKVWVESKPVIPTTLLEYGKSLKNINAITSYLEKERF